MGENTDLLSKMDAILNLIKEKFVLKCQHIFYAFSQSDALIHPILFIQTDFLVIHPALNFILPNGIEIDFDPLDVNIVAKLGDKFLETLSDLDKNKIDPSQYQIFTEAQAIQYLQINPPIIDAFKKIMGLFNQKSIRPDPNKGLIYETWLSDRIHALLSIKGIEFDRENYFDSANRGLVKILDNLQSLGVNIEYSKRTIEIEIDNEYDATDPGVIDLWENDLAEAKLLIAHLHPIFESEGFKTLVFMPSDPNPEIAEMREIINLSQLAPKTPEAPSQVPEKPQFKQIPNNPKATKPKPSQKPQEKIPIQKPSKEAKSGQSVKKAKATKPKPPKKKTESPKENLPTEIEIPNIEFELIDEPIFLEISDIKKGSTYQIYITALLNMYEIIWVNNYTKRQYTNRFDTINELFAYIMKNPTIAKSEKLKLQKIVEKK